MSRGGGDHDAGGDAFREGRRPRQRLHPAHRPADHRLEPLDPEMIKQHRLRAHHVADGDDGKLHTIGRAGFRIGARRPRRAHAASEHVGADEKMPRGRSEEHTSELKSLMRISYAVFCLKNKKKINSNYNNISLHYTDASWK